MWLAVIRHLSCQRYILELQIQEQLTLILQKNDKILLLKVISRNADDLRYGNTSVQPIRAGCTSASINSNEFNQMGEGGQLNKKWVGLLTKLHLLSKLHKTRYKHE